MHKASYRNFVRPSTQDNSAKNVLRCTLNGEEAKRLYLEEIKETDSSNYKNRATRSKCLNKNQPTTKITNLKVVSMKDLFLSVQNDDIMSLNEMLDSCPHLLNSTDDYGWSLLMIACQAGSVDSVNELLKRGCDIMISDKAGNSAYSLILKNRNYVLADLLHRYKTGTFDKTKPKITAEGKEYTKQRTQSKLEEKIDIYSCPTCNQNFPDKEQHLSSTLHNISASKGRKIPTNYVIPESNKGYQIMLKVGWDKEQGLGPGGLGKKYPIKTIQKKDRKGLGLEIKKRNKESDANLRCINNKLINKHCKRDKSMEINFRRQFY